MTKHTKLTHHTGPRPRSTAPPADDTNSETLDRTDSALSEDAHVRARPEEKPQRVPLTFHLTRAQRAILFRAFDGVERMVRRGGRSWCRAYHLEAVCMDYVSGRGSPRMLRPARPDEKRHPLQLSAYPDQLDGILGAIEIARRVAGCEDDGAALADIAATFLATTYQQEFRGPEWPNTAWSGRPGGRHSAGLPHSNPKPGTQRRKNPKARSTPMTSSERESLSLYLPFHHSLEDPPSVDHRRAAAPSRHTLPGGTSKVECDGRHDRPRSTPGPCGGGAAAKAVQERPDASGRLPFTSVAELAEVLGEPEAWLWELSQQAEDRYLRGRVPKRTGGWRPIDEPDLVLMGTQERLLDRVFAPLVSPSAIAYAVKGRGHIAAARCHVCCRWVGSTDIEAFFASITSDRVHELLVAMGCDDDLAGLLARLLTYRGVLPQGAPTSPWIANVLLVGVDRRVHAAAVRCGVTVTRYVDDWVVSGDDRNAVVYILERIGRELKELRLRENPEKRTLARSDQRQQAHGLIVNKKQLSVPKEYRKALERAVYRAEREGCTEREFRHLAGQIDYVAQFHRAEARKLHATLRKAAPAAESPRPGRRTPRRRGRWFRGETFGARAERRAAQEHQGARRTIASGRFAFDPGDYEVGDFLFECKATRATSISIRFSWLRKIAAEAMRRNKQPALQTRSCYRDGRARPDGDWIFVSEFAWDELQVSDGFLPTCVQPRRGSKTISLDDLAEIRRDAEAQGMQPALVITFPCQGLRGCPMRWIGVEGDVWRELVGGRGGRP